MTSQAAIHGGAPPATSAHSSGAEADGKASVAQDTASKLTRDRADAALAFVSQGVSSATNFLRTVFVARVCTETELGFYSLGFTIILLMAAMNERLVDASYTVLAYRRKGEAARALLGSGACLSVAWVVPAALLTALAGWGMWALTPQAGLAQMMFAVALVLPAHVLREFARATSFTHFRMKVALAIDVLTLVTQAIALFVLWRADWLNVTTIYAAIAVSCLAPFVAWAWSWRNEWSINSNRLLKDWSQIWGFSRWLVAARLMGNGSRMMIPWFVYGALGEGAAGRLGVCMGLVGLSWLFVRGLNNFFRPYVVRSFVEGGVPAVRRAVLLTAVSPTVFLAPVCLLFLFAGNNLLSLIYGPTFFGAKAVIVILALDTVAVCWAAAAGGGLVAIGRPRSNLSVEAMTLVGTLAGALLVIPFGIEGAAAAMLLGNLLGLTGSFWLFEKALVEIDAQAKQPAGGLS